MPSAINLIGNKYGELTVIDMLYNYQGKKRTYCKCVNDDGETVIVRQDALQSGATKTAYGSRNKGKYKDLTGMIFGKLNVISLLEERDKNGSCIWRCECECGGTRNVSSGDLLRGRVVSCGCSVQKYYDSLSLDITGEKFGMLTAIEQAGRIGHSGNYKRLWKCKCECGNEVFVTVNDLRAGNTISCGCRKISHGELYIMSLLNDNNIRFTHQHKFDDCKNKFQLPFDFYLPDYNICIEYDGKQHFEPVDLFGGEDGFAKRQKNDNIKNKYCLEHNITLIRIPYTLSKEEISNCVLSILSPVTITA